jgi:hypothetical protein
MSISLRTHKLLWGASGNACAKCKSLLVEDATLTDDASLVGEEAHIVSKKENGPRYADPLPMDRRDLFENLILLCNRCHKIVDDQVNTYPADDLRQLKEDHETAVRSSISDENSAKLRDDVVYSEYIQHWESATELDHWSAWTSYMLSADAPCMRTELRDGLTELDEYLLNRVWPHRYLDLEHAFGAFRRVLNDLIREFGRHMRHDHHETGVVSTEKFYKMYGWLEQDEFHWRVDQYEFHTDTLRDLTLELTRAANLICDLVRRHISPAYRLDEGRLVVSIGPFSDLSIRTFVPEYKGDDRRTLYPGFEAFLAARASRDYAAGRGTEAVRGYSDG